jgi:hypothetical protein
MRPRQREEPPPKNSPRAGQTQYRLKQETGQSTLQGLAGPDRNAYRQQSPMVLTRIIMPKDAETFQTRLFFFKSGHILVPSSLNSSLELVCPSLCAKHYARPGDSVFLVRAQRKPARWLYVVIAGHRSNPECSRNASEGQLFQTQWEDMETLQRKGDQDRRSSWWWEQGMALLLLNNHPVSASE